MSNARGETCLWEGESYGARERFPGHLDAFGGRLGVVNLTPLPHPRKPFRSASLPFLIWPNSYQLIFLGAKAKTPNEFGPEKASQQLPGPSRLC